MGHPLHFCRILGGIHSSSSGFTFQGEQSFFAFSNAFEELILTLGI
jgi:hypothetical protein